jgi:hypothetical protein
MTEQGSSNPTNQPASSSDEPSPEELPMPPTGDAAPATDAALPPPPSFGLQVAQLVIIPLVIVAVAVGVSMLFGKLASVEESTANLVQKLEQSSGSGRMVAGVQDPRYKDRWLAAFNIAARIPQITKESERASLSDDLVRILDHNVGDDEGLLQLYLLPAIGQLGQPGGLDAVRGKLAASDPRVQQGAIRGILSWPSRDEARLALPALVEVLKSNEPAVQLEAAAAVGALATPDEAYAIAGLHDLMDRTLTQSQEAHWNAAVALACLGDDRGSKYVADVLLSRDTLAKITLEAEADAPRPVSEPGMPRVAQDRVILSTLASAERMNSAIVWNKIRTIADDDPSLSVRKAAIELMARHNAPAEAGVRDGSSD